MAPRVLFRVLGWKWPLRRALIALTALTATACMTWQRVPDRPDELIRRHPDYVIRVTRHVGGRIELDHAFVAGDSIGGRVYGNTDVSAVMIPLSNVNYIEVERLDGGRTALLVAAAGATAIAVAGATHEPHSAPPPPPPPPPSSSGGTAGCYLCGLGSCPFVYSWDGARWRLDSGTFGGAIARGLQRTDVDNLDYATPRGDLLKLRVTNELAETDHLDALQVLAVDHEPGVAVAPDISGALHTIGALTAPVRARDFRGADALARVSAADGWSWESDISGRHPARTADLRDGLVLTFARPAGVTRARLVLDGNNTLWATHLLEEFVRIHGAATQAWYDSLNASPAMADAVQRRFAQEAYLSAFVATRAGWRYAGTFGGAGAEAQKRQVVELDLSQVEGDSVLVRVESAPSFWLIDRIAIDFTPERPLSIHELPLIAARTHDERDVTSLLATVDGRELVQTTGEWTDLSYRVPALPAGTARSFILRSTGWYRVETAATGAPDVATLDLVARDSLGIARGSIERLNAAVARFGERTR